MNTTQDHTLAMLPVTQLVPDEAYQPREGLDETHVKLLSASDPDTWLPLLVAPDGTGYYVIIDGFHRLEAAKCLKRIFPNPP